MAEQVSSTFEKCPALVDAKKDSQNQLSSSLVTKAANTFSRILYKELRKENQENLIVSPFSLSTALAMITPGAKGSTHSQLKEALSLPSMTETETGYRCLLPRLQSNDNFTLETANKVFVRKGLKPERRYMEKLKTSFHAAAQEINFARRAA